MYDYILVTHFPKFFSLHLSTKLIAPGNHDPPVFIGQNYRATKSLNGVLGFICFIIAQFMLPTPPCLTLLLHPSKVQSSHILVPLRKTINSTLLKDAPKTIFGTRSLEEQLPSSYTEGIGHPSSHTRLCAQPSITLANLSAPTRSNRMGSLQ
jgi:hypothetical protein